MAAIHAAAVVYLGERVLIGSPVAFCKADLKGRHFDGPEAVCMNLRARSGRDGSFGGVWRVIQ